MSRISSNMIRLAGACLIGYGVGKALLRNSRWFSLNGKRCLVTGGSRGLGLVIARQLVQAGARVAICSRTDEDIQRAVEQLEGIGGDVKGFVCDVRDPAAIKRMCEELSHDWHGLDVLFNVAGVMIVGPYETMTDSDYRDSMDTNCWGALNVIQEVVPMMREQRWGRILNVASIGGKMAIPHMLPYAASKFALVGLTEGLRLELATEGITVTTACPTMMRTGSPRNATFKGRNRDEFIWFSVGDSLPILSMDAERAASVIISACQYGDKEVWVTNPIDPVVPMIRWAPHLTSAIVQLASRLLPAPGGLGKNTAFGYESESALSPSILTHLSDEAAARNNELGTRSHRP